MSLVSKRGVAVVGAEFLGTALLTLVVLAAVRGVGIPYFVCLAAGLAVGVGILMLGKTSGGHFNPAVSLGLWSVRKLPTLHTVVYVAAQLLGALTASKLYDYLLNVTSANTATPDFQAQVLVAEALGTFVLCMGVASAVYHRYSTGRTAATVTVALFLGALVATLASGGVINPALALGTHSWVWGTYVLGPVLGGVIAFNLYSLLFAPEVEAASTVTAVKTVKAKNLKKK